MFLFNFFYFLNSFDIIKNTQNTQSFECYRILMKMKFDDKYLRRNFKNVRYKLFSNRVIGHLALCEQLPLYQIERDMAIRLLRTHNNKSIAFTV